MVNPILVLRDKFWPKNVANVMKFVNFIIHERPRNIKFGGKKNLKGQELFSRKVRRNPLTGKIPMIPTNADFQNTHNIVGGIDTRTNSVWYRIQRNLEGTNNSDSFFDIIIDAISDGFLQS